MLEKEAILRVTSLEFRLEEREREIEKLLNSSNEQRAKTVEGFEVLLTSERAAKVEAAARAEALSLQLQIVQGELDSLQTQLMSVRNHETALDTKLKSYNDVPTISPAGTSRSKRPFVEEVAFEFTGHEMEVDNVMIHQKFKKEKITDNGSSLVETEEGHNSNEVSRELQTQTPGADYHKLTVAKLKQKLTEAGFGEEVSQVKNSATKKDLIALYEKLMLPK